MPEAPEVEAVVRTLRPFVRGRRILGCRVIHPIAVRPQSPSQLARSLRGRRIENVERRGKYLLLKLDRGWLAMHFRLDGQLFFLGASRPTGAGGPHVDVALELDTATLAFADRRHFGRVWRLSSPEELAGVQSLGVDAYSAEFTPARFETLLHNSKRPLKLLLMDQTRIAGLGNIYSNEALWRARLSPRRRADRVSPTAARLLHKAIVAVLRRALECCLDPAPDFRNPDWWFSGLEEILRVYGREDKPCRRCGTRIRRIEQGGRSSFFCPGCQQ